MIPFTVETNQTPGRPALLVDLNGVLVHSFCPDLGEDPPDLDANEYHVSDVDFVRKDAERFLLGASQICDVYVWSSMKLTNVQEKIKRCLPNAIKFLSGWLGQECCEVANFKFVKGKPVFFKTLAGFFQGYKDKYHEGNVLAIDDSWYKHMYNPAGTYVILPKDRRNGYMVDALMWLQQWRDAEDRAGLVKSWKQPDRKAEDLFVAKHMEHGSKMEYELWKGTQRWHRQNN